MTVVTGVVENVFNPNWGSETFSVGGHKYDISNNPSDVGFHQTTANWGPLHNGLQVRISSVGDVIVRLEIITGP